MLPESKALVRIPVGGGMMLVCRELYEQFKTERDEWKRHGSKYDYPRPVRLKLLEQARAEGLIA